MKVRSKILVVDDEKSIIDLVTAYLRQEGFERPHGDWTARRASRQRGPSSPTWSCWT